MVKSAHKVLNSISSITDPIEPLYDYWLRRNDMAGDLKVALKAHVEALYWTERQLDTVSKPGQQLETRARKQFKENLKAIFTRYNPPSETADFHDSLGAFIADTLEAFDL